MIYKFYRQRIFPHLLNQVMQTASLMDKRRELLLPVAGEVLEIGFGTGLNLPFYQQVDTLYALEPNPDIYRLAAQRVHEAPFDVQHIQASAEKLPFASASLDHIVSTWTLCSIANLEQALAEIYRMLKPGGALHLVEHVLHSENRNIERALKDAGLELAECRYFDAEGIPKIAQRMLLARAVRP